MYNCRRALLVSSSGRALVHRRCAAIEAHVSTGYRRIGAGYVDMTTAEYTRAFVVNRDLTHTIDQLRAQAAAGGGDKAIARNRKMNKMLVRERFAHLLDAGAPFIELGTLAGHDEDLPGAGAGVVTGVGMVNGRFAVITGHDSTIKSGAIYPMSLTKQLKVQRLSEALGLPSIIIMDTGGAFLPLQAEIFGRGGRVFRNEATLAAQGLPQLSIVVGSCVAGGAYGPTMTDNAVMVDKLGTLFLGGPALTRAATGEVVTAEQLGDARRPTDKTYAYQVLARLVDGSELCEFKAMYTTALVCGWARIAGATVGVMCATGAPITAPSASSAAQFVQMCDDAALPLVMLQRTVHDGWSEYGHEDMKAHAQLMSALATTNSHKLVVNTGDALGVDHWLTCGASFEPTYYFQWPCARIAHNADDVATVMGDVAALVVHDVVRPEDTRAMLVDCLKTLPREQRASGLDDHDRYKVIRF